MSENDKPKKLAPPYVPYKTFRNFLDSMRIAIPGRIDRSLMSSMSGSLQGQLIAALEYLQLIQSGTGAVSEKLAKLVRADGEERQQLLSDIIKTSYRELFCDGFNLQNATSQQIHEQFGKYGTSGDTTRRCIAFFMNACEDAGVTVSPHFKRSPGPRAGSSVIRKRTSNQSKAKNSAVDEIDYGNSSDDSCDGNDGINANKGSRNDSWEIELLSKFPNFDPSWPDDVKAKWFDGFKNLMSLKKN